MRIGRGVCRGARGVTSWNEGESQGGRTGRGGRERNRLNCAQHKDDNVGETACVPVLWESLTGGMGRAEAKWQRGAAGWGVDGIKNVLR